MAGNSNREAVKEMVLRLQESLGHEALNFGLTDTEWTVEEGLVTIGKGMDMVIERYEDEKRKQLEKQMEKAEVEREVQKQDEQIQTKEEAKPVVSWHLHLLNPL